MMKTKYIWNDLKGENEITIIFTVVIDTPK